MIPAMTLMKDFLARRGRVPAVVQSMDTTDMSYIKTLTEAELRQAMQAHFRRFVVAARVSRDRSTGEPVVEVEFAGREPRP